MGSKRGPKATDLDADSFDDFEDDFDDNLGNLKNLSRDFYSTDWEDPSERFSTRRKIERRKDLRDLYSQFDDGDELDFGNEW
jgi:hypothetical protein